MGKYLAWIGTTVIALAGIVIGVLPIDSGPRWVWLTVGIGLGISAKPVAMLTLRAEWAMTSELVATPYGGQ